MSRISVLQSQLNKKFQHEKNGGVRWGLVARRRTIFSNFKMLQKKISKWLDFDEHSRRFYFKITKIRFYGSVFHALKNVSLKSRIFSDNYSMSLIFLKMTCPGMSSL